MTRYARYIGKTLAVVAMALYLAVAVASPLVVLSGGHNHGMHAACPFMLGASPSLCDMTVLEHLTHWHTAFAGVVSDTVVLSILLIATVVFFTRQLFKPPKKIQYVSLQKSDTPFCPPIVFLLATSLFPRAP